MSNGLKIETQVLENTVKIEVIGEIDEDSNFDKIIAIHQDIYIFNLGKVTLINSCGVREWINFLEKLPDESRIVYNDVPQIVVEQINMVKGFLKAESKIESFFAPYYSEEKDEVMFILLSVDQVRDGKAPEIKDDDGNILEFDAIEAQYFNFIKQQGL
jgi:hypothetical protein